MEKENHWCSKRNFCYVNNQKSKRNFCFVNNLREDKYIFLLVCTIFRSSFSIPIFFLLTLNNTNQVQIKKRYYDGYVTKRQSFYRKHQMAKARNINSSFRIFKYLVVILLNTLIAQGRRARSQLNPVLWNQKITELQKTIIYNCRPTSSSLVMQKWQVGRIQNCLFLPKCVLYS